MMNWMRSPLVPLPVSALPFWFESTKCVPWASDLSSVIRAAGGAGGSAVSALASSLTGWACGPWALAVASL